jgi:hypothetical protein
MYKIRKKNLDTIGNFGMALDSFSKLKEKKMKESLGFRPKDQHLILVVGPDTETQVL